MVVCEPGVNMTRLSRTKLIKSEAASVSLTVSMFPCQATKLHYFLGNEMEKRGIFKYKTRDNVLDLQRKQPVD